jgi:hypothetical protein
VAIQIPLHAQSGINEFGSFEQQIPAYWTKGAEPGGSTLSWATDQYRSMNKSLKISKQVTGEAAVWESEYMQDLWSPQHYKNVDIFIGAYVKTEGVNTNPTNDDQKWWISYTFYNQQGTLIGETMLPIDQSTATSSGWIADTNAVGVTILPEDSWKTIIKFVGGKNATGTVWADDFMLVGRNGAWAGQNWNTSLEMSTGWNYWLPPNGGNDGKLSNGFENTVITTEESYTGLHSLKFDLPFDRAPHDAWVGTQRYPISAKAGDVYRISVWVKASNLVPDSAAKYPGTWSVGLTPIFHSGYLPNDPYDEIGAKDLVFAFPAVTQFGWTKYYVDVTVPDDPKVKSLSVRIHPYSRFTGKIYFDELELSVISLTDVQSDKVIPENFSLSQNFPNPFNPSTIISYSLPTNSFVSLIIYDLLGREVKTLVNNDQNSGTYKVQWNGENNFGSKVSSGLYIYTIRSGQFNESRKMVLLK